MPDNFLPQYEANKIDPFLAGAASEENALAETVRLNGRNADIDIAADEDVHDAGGDYPFLTTARTHNVVSGSANDAGGVQATGTLTLNDNNVLEDTDEGTVTIVDYAKANGEKAVGRITITDYTALAGKTITVDDTTITEGVDFDAEVDNEKTAQNIADALAGETAVTVSVNEATAVVLIEAASIGTAGNSIALETNAASGITLSGATLSGGKAVLTITVGEDDLVAGTDFDAETDNDTTAENLATAIAALTGVGATSDGAVVTITDDTAGVVTSKDLATSNTSAATVSGATLSGGSDLLTVEVNSVSLVAGVDFDVGDDEEETAANLAAAINASEDVGLDGIVTAEAAGAVVTITAVAKGTAANSYTLAADTDSATASGATMAGGRADGTGARQVKIKGVDANYAEIEETVSLNGTTNVLTSNSFLRINSMEVIEAGSGGVNAGAITATATTAGTVTAKINTGENSAQQAVYTVPASRAGYVLAMSLAQLKEATGAVMARLMVRRFGEVWKTENYMQSNADGQSEQVRHFRTPVYLPAKADVRIRAGVSADNTDVAAGLEILLV